jgi:hypothetical protein
MNTKDQFDPGRDDRDMDTNKEGDLGELKDNLHYNKEDDSFELDVDSEDGEYDHPDPYETSVKNGGDADSDYDQANPTAVHEYDKHASLETDVDNLSMHIDNGDIVNVDPIDKELALTPEDKRDDLDEEGYPINDQVDPD